MTARDVTGVGRAREAASLGVILAAVASSLLSACKGEGATSVDASASAAPSATPAHTHEALPPPRHEAPKPAPLPCRILEISGAVTILPDAPDAAHAGDAGGPSADAGAPAVGTTVPRGASIQLAAGAHVALKSPHTAREVSFAGPGLVRACMGDDDDAWVVRGTFSSVAGTGEGPGAEQWVVTPLGAVRYAGGSLTVRVTDEKTEVETTTGARVFAFAAEGATPEEGATDGGAADAGDGNADGWDPVSKGHPWRRTTKTPAGAAALALAKREFDVCREGAKSARSLATAMTFPDADLTVDAPAHIAARRAARASCTIAAVRISALPASADREALGRALASGGDFAAIGPSKQTP